MEGGVAAADIVCGDINPSGKLVDTFAKSFDDYPSSATFCEAADYVKYYEDIYMSDIDILKQFLKRRKGWSIILSVSDRHIQSLR